METHNVFIKIIRFFLVPFLNSIPAGILQRVIKKSSPYGSKVIEKPGTTHSLENMYTKHETRTKNFFKHLGDSFWHNVISQPKAIRNRLRIVEEKLEGELRNVIQNGGQPNIYNLGGGSSRAVIKTVAKLKSETGAQITVSTIDRDSNALGLGNNLAQKHGVENLFTWIDGDVRNISSLLEDNSAHVVEMVGLLDYFDNEASVKLITQIRNKIKPGGLFIVANVHPNNESTFVTNVGWPKMYYKSSKELFDILEKSGFTNSGIDILFEPLKVHIVGTARKN